MKSLLNRNKLLSTFIFIYLILSLFVFYYVPKGAEVIYLNNSHTSLYDYIFYFITYAGDGLFIVLIVCVLFFVRYYYAIICLASFLLTSLFVQVLKKGIFSDSVRPKLFLQEHFEYALHVALDTRIHEYQSFPSGHSTSAMALAISLSLLLPNKFMTLLTLFVAVLVAISRMYLGQHFFVDTFIGSLIAISTTFGIVYVSENYFLWNKNGNLQKSLLSSH